MVDVILDVVGHTFIEIAARGGNRSGGGVHLLTLLVVVVVLGYVY